MLLDDCLKVLVACEESQRVCCEFRCLGHEAFSCDLRDCSGGHPEWHIKDDVLKHLNDGWDIIIAFPPCTYLTNVCPGNSSDPVRYKERIKALDFLYRIKHCDCDFIAIENPVGFLNSKLKPDQVIHPFFFGDPYSKSTCLWLKNLPKLVPTDYLIGEFPSWVYISDRDPVRRSRIFPGIARAMASQWSEYVSKYKPLMLDLEV